MAVGIAGWLTLHWAAPQGGRCPPLTLAKRSRRSFLCIPQSGRMITDNWRKKLEHHRLVRHLAIHFAGLWTQKQTFFCSTESVGRRQISSTHRVEVGQPCWQMLHSDPPFNVTVSSTDLFILWRKNTITHKELSLGLLQTDSCYVSGGSCDFLRTCVKFVRLGLIDSIRYSHYCATYVFILFVLSLFCLFFGPPFAISFSDKFRLSSYNGRPRLGDSGSCL